MLVLIIFSPELSERFKLVIAFNIIMKDCITCRYNKDPSNIPGGRIKEYNYWILEHINEPIPVKGWLVLKTKRHTEGIVGLDKAESLELAEILESLPKIQKNIFNAEQIYICCFTELVKHLHIHFIPRTYNETKLGTDLFNLISEVRLDNSKAIDPESVISFVDRLRNLL